MRAVGINYANCPHYLLVADFKTWDLILAVSQIGKYNLRVSLEHGKRDENSANLVC